MRLLLGVLLGVVGGVACTRLFVRSSPNEVVAAEALGEQATSCPPCVDVNGDSRLNVADPIYMLNWLFLGGPVPRCPTGRLPATGQTVCYDGKLALSSCPDPGLPFGGQDGWYQAGCPMAGRFVDNGDGTVSDVCTGLMWQRETAPETYTWQGGLEYSENLTLADRSDWRLPNIRELLSLVDYGRVNPCIDPVFGGASSSSYWSSSTNVQDSSTAWHVGFGGGRVEDGGKSSTRYIRSVRTIQPGE